MLVNPKKARDFDDLWRDESAKEVDSFSLVRSNDSLLISVGKSYLFVHPDLKDKKPTLDDYWKGMVENIRIFSPDDNPLVQVRWFWAKKDIEEALRGMRVDRNLRRILDAMEENELCPGEELVINSSDAIECDVEIICLTDSENQEPVVEYFFRFGWQEGSKTMHGPSPYGCGRDICKTVWAPKDEEQRYCYGCKKWYHVSCLPGKVRPQEAILEDAALSLGTSPIPTILLEIAFQPAARGGVQHFTAGNIRIVTMARNLVLDEEERLRFTKGMDWDCDEWMATLRDEFGVLEEDVGDFNREQLVVETQNSYQCAGCKGLI